VIDLNALALVRIRQITGVDPAPIQAETDVAPTVVVQASEDLYLGAGDDTHHERIRPVGTGAQVHRLRRVRDSLRQRNRRRGKQ
jgi:hypothetical protein